MATRYDRVIVGVYAINHGANVYVGESVDILRRQSYTLAERLGLPFGIVTEMPGSSARQRWAEEERVSEVFRRRGFVVRNETKTVRSALTRAKISATSRGTPKTAEHRQNLGIARRLRETRRRAA